MQSLEQSKIITEEKWLKKITEHDHNVRKFEDSILPDNHLLPNETDLSDNLM